MQLSTLFGFGNPVQANSFDPMPEIYGFDLICDEFVKTDIIHIYSKILTDVIERTNGLNSSDQMLLWDNCLKSESEKGLITTLAEAMFNKSDLYLVYDSGIIRKATTQEQSQIKADYAKQATSKVGIYISFSKYRKTDMLVIYSQFEYLTLKSLNKTSNLASAIQFKINDLRGSTSLADQEAVKSQAKEIALNLKAGRDVGMDGKDSIVTATIDMEPTKASIEFLNQKRSFYLGLPASYILGEQTGGMNATGEADTKAIERGLKNYYFSIIKPVIEALFSVKLNYKSQDFRQLTQGLEALKTFSIVDDSLISYEDKQDIINQLFDFDTEYGSDKKGDIKKVQAKVAPVNDKIPTGQNT